MHREFCTLFDRNYLSRALVLCRSLAEHCPDHRLWAYCVDEETWRVLRKLALPDVVVVPLSALEARDPRLRDVKATRSQTEYYWTLSPEICLDVFAQAPNVDLVTRVDADVCFLSDPEGALAELGENSVLLTPHRPAPEFMDTSGEPGRWGGRV